MDQDQAPPLPNGGRDVRAGAAAHPDVLVFRMSLPEGRCEYVSEGVRSLTGYSPAEFRTGFLLRDIILAPSREHFDRAWARLCSGEVQPAFEYAVRHRSGATRWLRQQSVLIRGPDGRPAAVEALVTDVSESRQTQDHLAALALQRTTELEESNRRLEALVAEREQALADLGESAAQLRLVIDHIPAAVSYVDADQRYRLNNRVYGDWFGCSPAELAGRKVREVLGEAAYANLAPNIHAALAGKEVDYEAVVPYQPGGARYVRASYVPHRAEDGEVKGFFVLVRDISEAKAAEEAGKRRLAELAHAGRLSALGEMAGQLTHEMIQPLKAISHEAAALARFLEQGRTEQARAVAEQLGVKTRQALDMVARLRRMSVRPPAEDRTPLDMQGLVAETLELLGYERGVSLRGVTVEASDPLPAVSADAVLIEQVLVNLLRNALEASAPTEDAEPRVTVGLRGRDGMLEVSVRDHGPGLSETTYAGLFEPFFTTKTNRVGLGLAICRRIVESHGGRIDARNHPGGGAVFAFTLPAEPTSG